MTESAGRSWSRQDRCPVDYECDGGPRCGWHTVTTTEVLRQFGMLPDPSDDARPTS